MEISNVKKLRDTYTNEIKTVTAIIDGLSLSVPIDSDNRHYAEILKQVEAGTLTIEEAD